MTLRDQHYMQQWQPLYFADQAGLRLDRILGFKMADYPGYTWTSTEAGASRADLSHAFTLIFVKPSA